MSAVNIFPVGIIGAGTMGCGVAELAAAANHTVHIFDRNSESLEKAEKNITRYFTNLVDKGRISPSFAQEAIARIHFDHRLEALERCRLVLEAIPEVMAEKQEVLKSVEAIVSESCILASNTSSLSIASIGGVLKNPERFLGLHFFNPAPVMALVEVVPGISTFDGTVQLAKNLIDSWGKVVVVAKDTPGFIANRVCRPFFSESLRLLEERIADAATIDWALRTIGGFRLGPFELLDFVGIDSNWATSMAMFEGFFYDERFRPSTLQQRLVEAKRLGRKSGIGFYDYGTTAAVPHPNKDPILAENIFRRIVSLLINEAADALFWGVGTRDDIDTAVMKGVNFPKGLFAWSDEIGTDQVVRKLDELFDQYREPRYRVNPKLREMVGSGQTFYGKNSNDNNK